MPLKRDAEGNIINERTRLIRRSELDPNAAETVALRNRHAQEIARPAVEGSAAPTKRVPGTRIYRPERPAASAADATGAAADDPMKDPPVGWLAIVDGPGKGRVLTLGTGRNFIGRDPTAQVSLDYGDAQISRFNHSSITYEPRSRKFYVQPGSGRNLTYVDDQPVAGAPRSGADGASAAGGHRAALRAALRNGFLVG